MFYMLYELKHNIQVALATKSLQIGDQSKQCQQHTNKKFEKYSTATGNITAPIGNSTFQEVAFQKFFAVKSNFKKSYHWTVRKTTCDSQFVSSLFFFLLLLKSVIILSHKNTAKSSTTLIANDTPTYVTASTKTMPQIQTKHLIRCFDTDCNTISLTSFSSVRSCDSSFSTKLVIQSMYSVIKISNS